MSTYEVKTNQNNCKAGPVMSRVQMHERYVDCKSNR